MDSPEALLWFVRSYDELMKSLKRYEVRGRACVGGHIRLHSGLSAAVGHFLTHISLNLLESDSCAASCAKLQLAVKCASELVCP